MSITLKLDRAFLFLRGEQLAIFAERILRNTRQNPHISYPDSLWDTLHGHSQALRQVLENTHLKRTERTAAIRKQEAPLLRALGQMAEYIEASAGCKSDAYTTGFRPQAEHRHLPGKTTPTRRKRRVAAKMAALAPLD